MTAPIPLHAARDRANAGAKAANLARLIGLGFGVPAGVVVPAAAFTAHAAERAPDALGVVKAAQEGLVRSAERRAQVLGVDLGQDTLGLPREAADGLDRPEHLAPAAHAVVSLDTSRPRRFAKRLGRCPVLAELPSRARFPVVRSGDRRIS